VLPELEQVHAGAAGNLAAAAKLAAADADFIAPYAAALADRAEQTGHGWRISREALEQSHPALRGRAVRLLCGRMGCSPGLRHVEAVLALSHGEQACLPGGVIARRQYGDLLLERPAPAPEAPAPMALEPGENIWGDWRITVSGPGLTVRTRRTGDTIRYHGHHKTVKKLLIDLQVPREDRDLVPLVCLADVPLAIGLQPDQRITACGFEIELRKTRA
jgi:tRNA(Ile)-lysidine synthetase-like protein